MSCVCFQTSCLSPHGFCSHMSQINSSLQFLSVDSVSPLKQQLDEGAGGGEGPVGGEEDWDKVGLPVLRVQQVGDQTLQCGGLQPAHLHRVVLGEAEGCRGLCRV